jgi:exopolysaccharide biosynthesis polyprenyl glycosylphosphotransferase
MLREHSKVIDQLSQFFDFALIAGAFFLALKLYENKVEPESMIRTEYFLIFLFYGLIWLLLANANNLYTSRRMMSMLNELWRLVQIHAMTMVGNLALLPLLFRGIIHDRFIFYFSFFSFVLTTLFHVVTRIALQSFRKYGKNIKYVMILGHGRAAANIIDKFRNYPALGYQVVGYVSPQSNGIDVQYLGEYSQLEQIIAGNVIDIVIVTESIFDPAVRESLELMHVMGKSVTAVMDSEIYRLSRMKPFELAGMSLVTMHSFPHDEWQEVIKRIIDVVFSGIGLIVASPLMLILAIIIKLTSKGPVFFGQERVGLNGRRFTMYKFRSMVQDAEALKAQLAHLNEMSGPVFKIKNDPRVTPIGHFLRNTSLDELPQLWNVFKQDMSLVGPRPPLPNEVNLYDPKHRKRISVRPGITCIWQISGRNDVDFDEWMEMDAEYVDNWSLALDVKILVKTIPVVLGRKGAS